MVLLDFGAVFVLWLGGLCYFSLLFLVLNSVGHAMPGVHCLLVFRCLGLFVCGTSGLVFDIVFAFALSWLVWVWLLLLYCFGSLIVLTL